MDISKPSQPQFFQVEPHHQSLLQPVPALPVPSAVSSLVFISKHKPSFLKDPQFHDYSQVPYLFYQLSRAKLPSGISLPCAQSADLRKLQSPNTDRVVSHLERWASTPGFDTADNSRWARIWGYYRASNEASFLWKLVYNANATQRWRNPTVSSSNPSLQCALCVAPAPEDDIHLLWDCPFAKRLWKWSFYLLSLRSGTTWVPSFQHAIFGKQLPYDFQQLQHWWEILRGILIWNILLHWNKVMFQSHGLWQSQSAIACSIWSQLLDYIKQDHARLLQCLRQASAPQS